MPKLLGNCVHCVRGPGTTWDHGIPRSWYPTGSTGPKVKAPSCLACNQRLKKIEEGLLLPLAMSLDPSDPRAAGVADAVMRSVDPNCAKNEEDRRHRIGRRRRVQQQIIYPRWSEGTMPGCEARPGSTGAALRLDPALLDDFAEKLVRVVYWSQYGQLIGAAHLVRAYVVERGRPEAGVAALIRGGERIEVPPGIFIGVRRTRHSLDGLLVIDLWGRIRWFASVERAGQHRGEARP